METYSNIRVRFSTDQAASYLNRTPGAIRNMVMRRQLPYRKFCGRLVFFKDEIDLLEDRSPGITVDKIISKFDLGTST
jgi:hypothetical protein